MIGALVAWLGASPFARTAIRLAATGFAIVLFLLALRSAGERTGRLAERLDVTEKANEIQRKMLEAAAGRPRGRDDLVERLRDGGF